MTLIEACIYTILVISVLLLLNALTWITLAS